MSEHLTAAEQAAVFERHTLALIAPESDEEWTAAAEAVASTATNHQTGYALVYALARAIAMLASKLTELGRTPVTAHEPSDAEERRRLTLALRFVLAAGHTETTDDAPAYDLFCRIERQAEHDGGRTMAALIFHEVHVLRQMGEQYSQALIDQEATR